MRFRLCLIAATAAALVLSSWPALAAQPSQIDLRVDGVGTVSAPLQVVMFLTLLTFVPAVLVIMTSFTRIAIVFHFLRQALGSQEMPSNQMLVGLTLFLTVFIMAPVGERVHALAIGPAMAGSITVTEALERGSPPLRTFLFKPTPAARLSPVLRTRRRSPLSC